VKQLARDSVNSMSEPMDWQTTTTSPQTVDETPVDPDLDLLKRYASAGDSDAFAQIVRRYAPVVYSTCLRVLGDAARAEDVSQETFFRLMRRPHEVTLSLGGWLHRAATHLALDALRSETARKRREIVYTRDCDHEASSWAELSPCVDEVLAELPAGMRILLVRHYLLGQAQSQIALENHQSPATICRRIKEALEELRHRLRLKGLYALPVALAGLLCHVSARQAPASLLRELGKMTMVSGSSGSASLKSTAARSAGHKLGASDRFIFKFMPSQMVLAIGGMIAAVLLLQFLMGAWSWHWNHATSPAVEPEDQPHARPASVLVVEGVDVSKEAHWQLTGSGSK